MACYPVPFAMTVLLSPDQMSRAERIATAPPEERQRLIAALSEYEIGALPNDWQFWARPKQVPPPGMWSTWVLRAGRGFGKALELSTPLPTPDGWTTMAAVRVGDRLFDETGAPCVVTAVHPVMLGRPCYRIAFSDGSAIVADADHRWLTHQRRYRKALARRVAGADHARNPAWAVRHAASVVTTAEMADSLMDGRERNHAIPLAGALRCEAKDLPLDPYLLGCWLGDGSTAASTITTADAEIVQAFADHGWGMKRSAARGLAASYAIGTGEDVLARCGSTGRMVATGTAWISKIAALGISGRKFVPPAYLRSSPEQRLALLQGLMDTDGHVTKRGNAEFCSTNRALADAVFDLCAGLSIKPVLAEDRAKLNGRDCGPRYRVTFTPYIPVFRLSRKLRRQRLPAAQALRQGRRYVVAVEPVASVPVRCIEVDSPSHLFLCGRGMIATHNSRAGAGWVGERANETKRWIALVARTPADARDYMIEGPSGLLRTGKPEQRPIYEPSKRRLTWPNGTWATIYSDEEPDQLRGFSGDTAWLDEFGKFRHAQDVWDNLQFGMREISADRPRRLITTTPRPLKILRTIEADPSTVVVTGSSYENRANLDPTWFTETIARYEGTRLGRQEIHAEILGEVPGALWTLRALDERRVRHEKEIPDLQRVVIGLDPNTAEPDDENAGLAEAGIVAVGLGVDGVAYVLDDLSDRLGPADWARRALSGMDRYEGDAIVAETNQGGAMVKNTIKAIRSTAKVIEVHASRGKVTRAEPVAALYEQGKVRHVGTHTALEDQMSMFTPYGIVGQTTADRVDALVWAITSLFPSLTRKVSPAQGIQVEGLGGFNPKAFGGQR